MTVEVGCGGGGPWWGTADHGGVRRGCHRRAVKAGLLSAADREDGGRERRIEGSRYGSMCKILMQLRVGHQTGTAAGRGRPLGWLGLRAAGRRGAARA